MTHDKKNKLFTRLIILSIIMGGGLLFFLYLNRFQPTVSVVMSTYNRAHLVSQAIDSILKQCVLFGCSRIVFFNGEICGFSIYK